MQIKLVSKELAKIRGELKKEMEIYGKQQEKLVEADTAHKKQAFKVDRIKTKGIKLLDKVLKEQYEMKEFDYFVNYEVIGGDTLDCQIQNLFEDSFGNLDGAKKKMREEVKNKTGMWADELMFTGYKK